MRYVGRKIFRLYKVFSSLPLFRLRRVVLAAVAVIFLSASTVSVSPSAVIAATLLLSLLLLGFTRG